VARRRLQSCIVDLLGRDHGFWLLDGNGGDHRGRNGCDHWGRNKRRDHGKRRWDRSKNRGNCRFGRFFEGLDEIQRKIIEIKIIETKLCGSRDDNITVRRTRERTIPIKVLSGTITETTTARGRFRSDMDRRNNRSGSNATDKGDIGLNADDGTGGSNMSATDQRRFGNGNLWRS